jgi:hypothetical protein
LITPTIIVPTDHGFWKPRGGVLGFWSRELAKVLARLGEGDVLMVTRLDRLARSTRDLLNVLDQVRKVARLRGGLIGSGLCLKSYTSTCSANISTPSSRPQAISVVIRRSRQQQEARARHEAGEAMVDIARTFNVSHSTISRLVARSG